MSTCDMIQPPKMSPFWLASAGIGTTRSAGAFLRELRTVMAGSISSFLQVVQRPAAERREAGAEDQARVGQVGVGDDALLDRLLRPRADTGSISASTSSWSTGSGCALHRLAVLPPVEALAGLLAELAATSERALPAPRRSRIRAGERLARGGADVEADGVGELDRAHRHAEVSIALSIVSGLTPSSSIRNAFGMYGPSTRLTRKPGASFTGSGSLSIWRTNAAPRCAKSGVRSRRPSRPRPAAAAAPG